MDFFHKKPLLQAMIIATSASLAACGSDDNDSDVTSRENVNNSSAHLKFVGVEAPATDAQKREILVSQAIVNGKVFGGDYTTFARSGEVIDGIAFGQLVDQAGSVLTAEDGSTRISDSNEFTSILPIGNKLFSVSQFEDRPGAMFLMELNQDKDNGALSVKTLKQIDQSTIDGGWVHCAGSVTPWTTHLASEEYEPNARDMVTAADAKTDDYVAGMLDYYADENSWNPYFYGWNIEVSVTEKANVSTQKHYAMGRLAFELSYVMPDEKTVYMTDDGTNVGLYMFVADNAGDLSSGTTYAAKWNQTSSTGVGAADLTWVSLGHASNAQISEYVHGENGKPQVKFSDIFETQDPVAENCAAGFTSINAGGNGQECLKIKTGMETVASRLETRRYAAMKGATTEFRKEEGITYDSKRHKLYVGMSEVAKGMLAGQSNDVGGPDHIQIDSKNSCGAVYQLDLAANTLMGSDYVAKNMYGLIAGRPVSDTDPQTVGFEANNSCHIDGIASPDNVTYISGYDLLVIGEDTSKHQNDVLWSLDFSDDSLTRIFTTPYGSETTSPYWYSNINGWAYLTAVVQHPYGESDEEKNTGAGEARAYTGYVGPFPAVNVQ